MDMNLLISKVSERMPVERFEHVLRVVETSQKLAEKYGVSTDKAEQAALLHDVAKFMDQQSLRLILERDNYDDRLLVFHHELWHGPVGAIIASKEFGIDDADVLNAVQYHTTGRSGMSPLEKIIYVADMIEPGRKFPGVEQLRETSMENIDAIMGACIHQSVQHLVSKRVPIFPDSIDCYNEHVMMKGIVK